jgi:hypothetical protein
MRMPELVFRGRSGLLFPPENKRHLKNPFTWVLTSIMTREVGRKETV